MFKILVLAQGATWFWRFKKSDKTPLFVSLEPMLPPMNSNPHIFHPSLKWEVSYQGQPTNPSQRNPLAPKRGSGNQNWLPGSPHWTPINLSMKPYQSQVWILSLKCQLETQNSLYGKLQVVFSFLKWKWKRCLRFWNAAKGTVKCSLNSLIQLNLLEYKISMNFPLWKHSCTVACCLI